MTPQYNSGFVSSDNLEEMTTHIPLDTSAAPSIIANQNYV
tara:strand:+ start:179 stop:298 length:120 start_codon:yes stop_codon:yes gene_type:complete